MVWVSSEYAGELAVVSVWISALVPWNVTYSPDVAGGSLLFVRFPFFQLRYTFGIPIPRGTLVGLPLPVSLPGFVPGWLVSAPTFQEGASLATAYWVWTAGAAVFAAAFAVSLAYYRREAWVESWAVDPVRLIGTLLLVTALILAAATYFVTFGFPGVPIPVGVVLMLLLGGVLLGAERRASEEPADSG